MTTLTTFLLARITEDEQAARDAGGAHWRWEHGSGDMCNDPTCPFGTLIAETQPHASHLLDVHGFDAADDWQGGPHIVRHDPARVLAECAAKRRIVSEHAASWDLGCSTCAQGARMDHGDAEVDRAPWPCATMRLLALPYADHPDYQHEWSLGD